MNRGGEGALVCLAYIVCYTRHIPEGWSSPSLRQFPTFRSPRDLQLSQSNYWFSLRAPAREGEKKKIHFLPFRFNTQLLPRLCVSATLPLSQKICKTLKLWISISVNGLFLHWTLIEWNLIIELIKLMK